MVGVPELNTVMGNHRYRSRLRNCWESHDFYIVKTKQLNIGVFGKIKKVVRGL